jgi:hypothetical protein
MNVSVAWGGAVSGSRGANHVWKNRTLLKAKGCGTQEQFRGDLWFAQGMTKP